MRSEEDIKALIQYYTLELAKEEAKRNSVNYDVLVEFNIRHIQTSLGWLRWFLGEE